MTNRLPSLTERLQQYSGGEREVAEAVLREVLPKLHLIATRELRRERQVAPLSPTELINEVWLRSLRHGGWQVNSRDHFYAIAALAMRRVLVDFARQRLAQRRGGASTPAVQLEDSMTPPAANHVDPEKVLEIGLLMERLEKRDLELARIVDMHYFAGFTLGEIADITGLTFRQVRHRWERARDWLKDRLQP